MWIVLFSSTKKETLAILGGEFEIEKNEDIPKLKRKGNPFNRNCPLQLPTVWKKSAGYGGLLIDGPKSLLPVYLVNDFFKLQVIMQINNTFEI
jgi:hypothetical protein